MAYARLVEPPQGSIFGGGAALVRQALHPGVTEERYGRVWHLGQVREEDGFFYGRLGFDYSVGVDLWAEEAKDFRKTRADRGAAAPFVIRMSDLVLVYQPRKQEIRPVAFAGALRSMLRLGKGGAEWRIESLNGGGTSFDAWRATIGDVTRLRFRFERRNLPKIPPSTLVGLLLEANPDLAAVEWRARRGLNTGAGLFRELLGQVEAGAGDLVAAGRSRQADNSMRSWNSVVGDESLMTEVEVDSEGDEVSRATLLDQIATIVRAA